MPTSLTMDCKLYRPAMPRATPKKIVSARTKAAIQNVYHCTLLRLSHHHCVRVSGSASSKSSLSVINRSCQNWKFSMHRSSALRRPHLITFVSSFWEVESLMNHFLVSLSVPGRRRASVLKVSSTRPAGNKVLMQSERLDVERARAGAIPPPLAF